MKRLSALLFDRSINIKMHYCMLCLTRFTRADLLENHQKYCNGVNSRPTRIKMPEEGKNAVCFQNYHKQMKVPYVIYADLEALVREIPHGKDGIARSLRIRLEGGEVRRRSDRVRVIQGGKAVGSFLAEILWEEFEEEIRKSLSIPRQFKMTPGDWEKFKTATDCHICGY